MARLPYPDPERLHPKAREALDRLPQPLNVFRMAAHAETCLRPLVSMGAALLARGELDPRLRELAILRVAQLTGARYEWVQHEALARVVRVTDSQIDAIAAGDITADVFDAHEQRVLRFTTEVSQDVRASDASLAALRQDLSDRAVVELTLAVGYYGMLARLMETCGVDLEQPVGAALIASARLPRES